MEVSPVGKNSSWWSSFCLPAKKKKKNKKTIQQQPKVEEKEIMLQFAILRNNVQFGFKMWQLRKAKHYRRGRSPRFLPAPGAFSHLGLTGRWILTSPHPAWFNAHESQEQNSERHHGALAEALLQQKHRAQLYLVFRLRYVARSFYKSDSSNSIILSLCLTGTWGRKPREQQNLTCGAQCSHSLLLLRENERNCITLNWLLKNWLALPLPDQ